jgi:hypothetical protein
MAIGANGHLGDDGNRRVDFPRRENRLLDLVQICERLEDEDICASVLESLKLFAERRARFVETRWTKRFEANPERSDSSRNKELVFGYFARELRCRAIDFRNLLL